MKGNYPYAVLHIFKTEGFGVAIAYAIQVAKEKLSREEARQYVQNVVKTNGQPHLIDLYERGVL